MYNFYVLCTNSPNKVLEKDKLQKLPKNVEFFIDI